MTFDKHMAIQAAVTLISAVINTKEAINAHLVICGSGREEFDKAFSKAMDWFDVTNCSICFYDFDENLTKNLPIAPTLTAAANARLFAATLLPNFIEKCVYLDSDILVNDDLRQIYDLDLGDYSLGAISDQLICKGGVGEVFLNVFGKELTRYFNSGVLILNLKKWRTSNAEKRLSDILKNAKTIFPDQDALNYLFHDDWLELEVKWNMMEILHKKQTLIYFKKQPIEKGVYHFTGGQKPWNRFCYSAPRHMYRNILFKLDTEFKLTPYDQLKKIIIMFTPYYLLEFYRKLKMRINNKRDVLS